MKMKKKSDIINVYESHKYNSECKKQIVGKYWIKFKRKQNDNVFCGERHVDIENV